VARLIGITGRDINLEILRVEGYRKFCNKIFNATKSAMLKLDKDFVPTAKAKVSSYEIVVSNYPNFVLALRERIPC